MRSNLISPEMVFPAWERDRVRSTTRRYMLAVEDCDELVERHMAFHLDEIRLARFGPPDTAMNPLVQIGLSVSTPGHYGQIPAITGDASGRLDTSTRSLWTKAQWREFLAYCLGACAQHVALVDGDPVFHVVPPCDLWAEAHPSDGTRPVVMRWLRARQVGGEALFAWEEWDVRDPAAPVFRVVVAGQGGELGADITEVVAPELVGVYPWVDASGRPFLPWSIDRSRDVGDLWNWKVGRGAAIGTLNTMMLSTAANRAALNSTGKIALILDGTIDIGSSTATSSGMTGRALAVNPGDLVTVHRTADGYQPSVSEIGEVDTLPALAQYAQSYSQHVVMSMGITPTDAMRVSANPMSGSAIHLTNAAKRDEQKRRNPLCQACDLATIAQVGALLGIDVSTVGIVYHEIQASPDELRNEREGDEWSVENGYASQVDVMMRRNPGMTRPQAIAELKRIAADEAALEAEEEIAEGEKVGHDFGEGIDDNEAKIIEATVSIVEKAAKGDIPAAGAKAILVEFYRIPPELADQLLGVAPPAGTPAPETATNGLVDGPEDEAMPSLTEEPATPQEGYSEAVSEADGCPIETQDIEANLKNRQKAIDVATYGPANPDVPGDYWQGKADRMRSTVDQVRTMVCGNCAFFNVGPRLTACIEKGIGADAGEVVAAGRLGWCEAFDFKCAAARTCDAWVVGGPVTE